MPSPVNEISGYFLSFSPDEKQAIEEMLYREGYPSGIDGLKQFILEAAADDAVGETEPPRGGGGSPLLKFMLDNPDTVEALKNSAARAFGNTIRKIYGVKTK